MARDSQNQNNWDERDGFAAEKKWLKSIKTFCNHDGKDPGGRDILGGAQPGGRNSR